MEDEEFVKKPPPGLVSSHFEKVLESVGMEGRYQKFLLYGFMVPLSFYLPFGASSLIMMLSTPDHHCYVPGRQDFNVSVQEWRNLTLPWEIGPHGNPEHSSCRMHNISSLYDTQSTSDNFTQLRIITNETVSCQFGWEYDRTDWHETSVTHFDWVCDGSSSVTTIFSIAVAGNAVGTLLLSVLSDKYGRRPLFYVAVTLNFVFGVMNLYMPTISLYAATRFLNSMAFFAIYQMPYIIVVELGSERLRAVTATLTFIVGTLGMCFLSLSAYLLKDWQSFGLLCHAPSILLFLYWRVLPESPRWLLSMGRLDECESIMLRVAAVNHTLPPPSLRRMLQDAQEEEKKKTSIKNLLQYPQLRKSLFLTSYNTIIFCVVYSGIILNIHNMTGNEFINFFVLSLVEIPGNLLGVFSAQFLGRRVTTVYSLTLCALFCVLASTAITNQWLLTFYCGMVKLFVTEAVLVIYMQVGELFPTPLRSISYGVTGVIGLTATILVPVLIAMGEMDLRLPYYILCGLCVSGALMSTLLPETLGQPLPQTVQEASMIGKNQPYCTLIHHWNKHKYTQAQEEDDDLPMAKYPTLTLDGPD